MIDLERANVREEALSEQEDNFPSELNRPSMIYNENNDI